MSIATFNPIKFKKSKEVLQKEEKSTFNPQRFQEYKKPVFDINKLQQEKQQFQIKEPEKKRPIQKFLPRHISGERFREQYPAEKISLTERYRERVTEPYLRHGQPALRWMFSTWLPSKLAGYKLSSEEQREALELSQAGWETDLSEAIKMKIQQGKRPEEVMQRTQEAIELGMAGFDEETTSEAFWRGFTSKVGGEILERGTKPSTWLTWYALQKTIPYLGKKIFNKLPPKWQNVLTKDIFNKADKELSKAYKVIGGNSKESFETLTSKYRNVVFKSHPDRGGNPELFKNVQNAWDLIKKSRVVSLPNFVKDFQTKKPLLELYAGLPITKESLISAIQKIDPAQTSQALIAFSIPKLQEILSGLKPDITPKPLIEEAKALPPGTYHRMPDGSIMPGKEHPEAISGSEFEVKAPAEIVKPPIKPEVKIFKEGLPEEQKLLEFNKLIKGEGFTAIPSTPEYRKFIRGLPENINKIEAIKRYKEVEKTLSKPLAISKVRPVIDRAVGKIKPKEPVITTKERVIEERILAQAKGAKFGLLEGRRQAKFIMKEKDLNIKARKDYAVTYLKQNLELKDRGKFIDAVKNATTDINIAKIISRAERVSVATGRSYAVNAIKKEIRITNAMIKRSRVRGKGKILWEAQDRLENIIDNLTSYKPEGKRQKALEEVVKFYIDNPNKSMPLKAKQQVADLQKTNISEMTTAEIRQTIEDIKNIKITGRTTLEAKENRRLIQQNLTKKYLVKSIEKHTISKRELLKDRPTLAERERSKWAKLKDSLNRATSELKIPAFTASWLDGFKVGQVTRAIIKPTDIASAKEETLKAEMNEKLKKILQPIKIKIGARGLYKKVEIFGRKFFRYELWSIYANSKNEANLATLIEDWGYNFSPKLVEKAIRELSPIEKRTIDRIMNEIIEPLYPETIRVTREYSGYTPRTVKNYWPIRGDKELSNRILLKEKEKDLMVDVFKKASMDIGSIKDRVGHSGPPDLHFFRVLKGHLDETIHFNTHALAIRDVQEILNDKEVRVAIEGSVGRGGYSSLKSSLSDIANPKKTPANWFEKQVGKLRRNTTAVMLGFKVSVSLLQGGSINQTVKRVGLGNTIWGIKTYWKNPRAADRFIYEQSSAQKFRRQKFDREVKDLIATDASIKKMLAGKIGGSNLVYQLITAIDHITTMPSWLAGYKQATQLKVKDLVFHADDIVRKTQPTGRVKDLARIMRGSEFQKMFTMFYTFFSNAYNNMAEATGKLRYGFAKEGVRGKIMSVGEFARAYLWLLIIPGLYAAIVRRPKKATDPVYLLKSILSYASGTIPFIRDFANVVINPQYEYTGSPIFGIGKSFKQLIAGKKVSTKIKAGVMIGGYLTGFPSQQALVTASGAIDLWEDNTDNPLRLFLSSWQLSEEKKSMERIRPTRKRRQRIERVRRTR